MLVLARNIQQRVVVNVDGRLVWIDVLKMRDHKVWLGFTADSDVRIDREEIHARKANETT